jgi:hypothetical protein
MTAIDKNTALLRTFLKAVGIARKALFRQRRRLTDGLAEIAHHIGLRMNDFTGFIVNNGFNTRNQLNIITNCA